jgi:RND family efflux transporter MFP subunit
MGVLVNARGWFLATVAMTILMTCCSAHKPEIPIAPVVKAYRANLATHLEIASELQPYQEVDVFAKVSGYIRDLSINWGTVVKRDQVLAVLEIPELEHQLQRDQAAISRSEHEVTRWREETSKANSAFTVARLTYGRLADVQEKQAGLIAQQDIDMAEGRYREADANVSAAKASLEAAEAALVDAQAALKQHQALYAYSRIRAPFDGIVTRIDAYTGALLPAATSSDRTASPLCHLAQNNLLRLVIALPQRVLDDVHVGETVTVHGETPNITFRGEIALFAGRVDFETRTMRTEVTVPNPSYELVPGAYVYVEIPLRRAENVVTLPAQAVQISGDDGTVLVVGNGNRIQKRLVKLGLLTATEVEILSGIHDGEIVVFGNQDQYVPEQTVIPKEVEVPQLEEDGSGASP